jgi:hypothetical protein
VKTEEDPFLCVSVISENFVAKPSSIRLISFIKKTLYFSISLIQSADKYFLRTYVYFLEITNELLRLHIFAESLKNRNGTLQKYTGRGQQQPMYKKHTSATFPTANPARNGMGSNTGLLGKRPATNRLSHNTAKCISTTGPIPIVFAQRKTAYNKTTLSHQSGCIVHDRPVPFTPQATCHIYKAAGC